MRIRVNGVSLFFEVIGPKLAPAGTSPPERPTVIVLHGGPGIDHTSLRGDLDPLGRVAQVIYLDQRGNGRSERGSLSTWNLATWAEDVRAFCDALGIERPIVFGNSFGGVVALVYATMYPGHPAKLVLHSTTAHFELEAALDKFRQHGGAAAEEIARRFFTDPSVDALEDYRRDCMPLYSCKRPVPVRAVPPAVLNIDVARHFIGGEWHTFDLRPHLFKIASPTLVQAGEEDVVFPRLCAETLTAGLPRDLLQFDSYSGCGHALFNDEPARVFAVLEAFVSG
jgi:pimeloyl-ACP methyl ester carboxylesterase